MNIWALVELFAITCHDRKHHVTTIYLTMFPCMRSEQESFFPKSISGLVSRLLSLPCGPRYGRAQWWRTRVVGACAVRFSSCCGLLVHVKVGSLGSGMRGVLQPEWCSKNPGEVSGLRVSKQPDKQPRGSTVHNREGTGSGSGNCLVGLKYHKNPFWKHFVFAGILCVRSAHKLRIGWSAIWRFSFAKAPQNQSK